VGGTVPHYGDESSREGRQKCSPVKVPLSDNTRDGDSPNTADHPPGPDPHQRDEEDEPAGIGSDVEDVRVLPGMSPVADHAETDEEGEEGNGR
jgi:hypothetical protein